MKVLYLANHFSFIHSVVMITLSIVRLVLKFRRLPLAIIATICTDVWPQRWRQDMEKYPYYCRCHLGPLDSVEDIWVVDGLVRPHPVYCTQTYRTVDCDTQNTQCAFFSPFICIFIGPLLFCIGLHDHRISKKINDQRTSS